MSDTAISVENISKYYRLGLIGGRTLQDDLAHKWAKIRGKPDPLLKIGQEDHGNVEGEFIWALRDINLEVKQGEILGIIGKNGAGKTTLLKILGKITAPTDGRVKLNGRLGCLIAVGTGFHPELTGRENIYLNGAILGMKKNEVKRKFDEIVDFSGVEKFIDTPIKRYSSGMNVRLGFSVAAHLDPEILLIDEVLAVGDAEFQKRCLGKMGEVAKVGRTVLFVSHNMASIKQLCSKVILLENGGISRSGDAYDTVNHYLSLSHGYYEESPIVDLKDYKNRRGTGKVYFEWAQLLDGRNKPKNSYEMETDMKIVFSIKLNGRDKGFKMGITIRDSNHLPVAKEFDIYSGFEIGQFIDKQTISVLFKDIRLYPGSYFVTIWMRDNHNNLCDVAEDCLRFDIIESGKHLPYTFSRRDGIVLFKPIWEISTIKCANLE